MTDAQSVSIRRAEERDRPALIALTAELQAFEMAFEPNRLPPAQMAAPYLAEIWEWAESRGGAIIVADLAGAPVGFVCCGVGGAGSEDLTEYASVGKITDIVVAEAQRGRGVGAALIRAAEEQIKQAGALRVEIAALAGNPGAQAAYQARGYRPAYVVFERYLGGSLAEKRAEKGA